MVKIRNIEEEHPISSKMFWGVTIDAGKKYSQTVQQSFHVSMAALDLNGKKNSENVQVIVQYDSSDYLLCTLNDKILQQSLDLNFNSGEKVAFSLNGSGVVHLTGYLAVDEEDFDVQSFSDSEEEVPSLVETPDNSALAIGNKRKKSSAGKTPKRTKLSTSASSLLDDDDDDDDDDDEDFSDDFDEDEFPDEEDSDIDSEEEDDEDEEEEEEEDATPARKDKTPKSAQKPKDQQVGNTPKQKKKQDEKSPKQATPSSNKSPKVESATPSAAENGEGSQKKKKKKKKNKDTSLNESTASSPGQTPKTETSLKKRVVAGGTIVEDLKVGHGPEAKPGKMVSVYYVGTLAKNQKRFDSCQGGKPFRFRLNQGEVIKGWDNGVNGMKVGGKRKITVPANQGYGNMKQGPIPPNSTLVFEVELKAVN